MVTEEVVVEYMYERDDSEGIYSVCQGLDILAPHLRKVRAGGGIVTCLNQIKIKTKSKPRARVKVCWLTYQVKGEIHTLTLQPLEGEPVRVIQGHPDTLAYLMIESLYRWWGPNSLTFNSYSTQEVR
jgi:hypothetical protein